MQTTIQTSSYKSAMAIWASDFPEYKFAKLLKTNGIIKLVVVI